MHYKNGREAKVGDPVVGKNYDGSLLVGTVVHINPGSTTCNLTIHSCVRAPAPSKESTWIHAGHIIAALLDGSVFHAQTNSAYTASEFLHVEDLLAAYEVQSAQPVPAAHPLPTQQPVNAPVAATTSEPAPVVKDAPPVGTSVSTEPAQPQEVK